METALTGFVVVESSTRTVVVETSFAWLVIVKPSARSVVVMETALAGFVIIESSTRTVVIVETAFAWLVVVESSARSVIVIETAARTLVVVKSSSRTVFVVETASWAVAKLAVASVVKVAFTSRLVAKSVSSFFVTLAVIELEGFSLLEFLFLSRSSGARTLARVFKICH